jgi:hypothetical protein
MKKQHVTPYLFTLALLAAALFLVACGAGAGAISAAPGNPVAIEDVTAIEAVAAVEADEIQAVTAAVQTISNEPETAAQETLDNSPGIAQAQGYGNGTGVHVPPTGELNADEIAALLYMREEEKLARDVYQAMYDIWGVPVFANIAESEQAHMNAIAYLLDAYDLADPAAGQGLGEFENAQLQALYNELVAQGQQSLEDALLAGAAIEEIDILDLQERLAQTSNAAITQTFENLLAGSVNHLGAFATNIERQTGLAYQPQYMSQSAYQALVSTTSGRGNGSGGFNGNGQGFGNGNAPGNGTPGGNNSGGNGRGTGYGNGRWQNS